MRKLNSKDAVTLLLLVFVHDMRSQEGVLSKDILFNSYI
jgi:hypothetical protein